MQLSKDPKAAGQILVQARNKMSKGIYIKAVIITQRK